jgi:AcrR family transcriptional regulator
LILDAAAFHFAAKGYEATSVRDIVRSVGMLPGSLYCHFANKEALLAAVYAEGVRRITQAVTEAVATRNDPWERLQAGCAAHLKALVEPSAYAKVVIAVEPGRVPALQDSMVSLRNGYERMFSRLVDDLPLPPRTPRRALRLMLLGAMNWAPNWYRSDGAHSPSRIAEDFVSLIRLHADR